MALRATPEKKEEKARTRAALLRAALQLGAAHGFSSVGLREVARVAGIAPTSFYRHFADMEELGLALAQDLVAPLMGQVRERARNDAGPPGDPLLALIDAVLEGAAADPELTRFILAELAGCSPRRRAALRAALSELSDTLRALFERASSGEPAARQLAEAATVLLLDGCLRDLDAGPGGRAGVREALAVSLNRLLASSSPRGAS